MNKQHSTLKQISINKMSLNTFEMKKISAFIQQIFASNFVTFCRRDGYSCTGIAFLRRCIDYLSLKLLTVFTMRFINQTVEVKMPSTG